MGWDVNIHVNLQKQLMLRTLGVGSGGMGWDVNVHVNLQKQLIVRTRGVGWGGWDVNVHVNLQMMMMMMTLMKLVNSATKFRHGIDKFYQPNSGLRSSRTWDEAIYTYICYPPPEPMFQKLRPCLKAYCHVAMI